jgi:hypothetical protein
MNYQPNKHQSVKGTLAMAARFQSTNSNRHIRCGPSSYKPEESIRKLSNPKCQAVFSKRPCNNFQFNNGQEFTVIGQTIKHNP